ncbi:hypothetical protein RvY_04376 [Ramazzottius varieornatus]|uniref:Uncharacterized protein n=1 Tax=Ramazzottius varieornatus TaxID=947166 RepID=A0A1D1URE9_RAMVA|nr:hypothetical protein RvY_04376 [Ramazzottius varieornatus]
MIQRKSKTRKQKKIIQLLKRILTEGNQKREFIKQVVLEAHGYVEQPSLKIFLLWLLFDAGKLNL